MMEDAYSLALIAVELARIEGRTDPTECLDEAMELVSKAQEFLFKVSAEESGRMWAEIQKKRLELKS